MEMFEVLLDKENVLTGEKWREVIREWVLGCDAAVVLLSEAATRSDYVKHELTLLQERQQSHPNRLMLLPVAVLQQLLSSYNLTFSSSIIFQESYL